MVCKNMQGYTIYIARDVAGTGCIESGNGIVSVCYKMDFSVLK